MTRFDFYRSPEPAPRRPRSRSALWAVLCIGLELSVLFLLWAVLNS
jgi:hypothetical protein